MDRIEEIVSCWCEQSETFHDFATIVEIGKKQSRVTLLNSKTGEIYFEASKKTYSYKNLEKKPYLYEPIKESLLVGIFLNQAS